MFNNERDNEQKHIEPKLIMVRPLRDFKIVHNEHCIELIKGERVEVPKMFVQNLKTEKVIK